jgi:hypothetical protein
MDSELFKSGLEQEEPKRPLCRKKKKKGQPCGGAHRAGAFAAVRYRPGNACAWRIALGQSFINNDKEKAKFEKFLLPVVMYDPPAFESVTTLDQAMLLQTSMWAAILNNDDAKWAKDDLGFAQIPPPSWMCRPRSCMAPR